MKIKNLIKTTWELPQNALGFIIKKVCKAEHIMTYKGVKVYSWNVPGGISLGNFIFVSITQKDLLTNKWVQFVKHEYGHTLQSRKLGWLYLFVIGLPSLIWAQCFQKYRDKTGTSYYAFYTERWADKLGGVERSNHG